MTNEAADIVQEIAEDQAEWKTKAKVAGSAALDATKAAYQELSDRTIEYSKATDRAIRENPYTAMGIAVAVGALLGFMMTRGSSKECED